MTVITNAVLRVWEQTCQGLVARLITESELEEEGQDREVEIYGRILKPNNQKNKNIKAVWDAQLKILMPIGTSNFFCKFIIGKEENQDNVWKVKYFENVSRRRKIFFNERTMNIDVVEEWLESKDYVYIITRYKGRTWEKYKLLAINEKICCVEDNVLIYYNI